jgi:D-sedoheptulose 7-phosphate isomerase
MAAEFVSRFRYDRPGLAAIALTTDTSIITAIGNDYGYETLFARQIQSLGNAGDVFVAYSTSGSSPNVLNGLTESRKRGLVCVGFTGSRGDAMRARCDIVVDVPAVDTSHVQEGHLILGHVICLLCEQAMFPRSR